MNRQEPSQTRIASGIIGGILLGIAALWLVWLLGHSIGVGRVGTGTTSGNGSTSPGSNSQLNVPVEQVQPLLAAGIQLGYPSKNAALSKQQAMFLADQLEADAASKAKNTDARYVTIKYPHTSTSTSHPDLNNVPVWLVTFQQVPFVRADNSVDSASYPQTTQNLYVFLDANSGKELLSVWA